MAASPRNLDISIRQIRYFIAAAETGSITRAAVATHVTQSAVTDAIKGLENQLGIELFQRSPKGVNLTYEGNQFLRSALAIIASLDDISRSLKSNESEAGGRIRLGVSSMVAGYFLSEILSRFHRLYSGIEVAIVEDRRIHLEHLLINGELDLALLVVSNLESHAALSYELLSRSQSQLWLHPAHPLVKLPSIRLQDICSEPVIVLSSEDFGRAVTRAWTDAGIEPNVFFETSSVEAVRSLVATGAALSIVPDALYRPWSLEGDRVEVRSLADACPTTDVGIVWRKGLELPMRVKYFLQVCSHFRSSDLSEQSSAALRINPTR